MLNNLQIIESGSSGNAIIYKDFLLDCGVPYNKINKYLKEIKYIFISHLHTDHCKSSTIKKINYEYPNIKFIVGEVNAKSLVDIGIRKQNIFSLELEKRYLLGDYEIKLDYLKHDVPNNAIHIFDRRTNKKFIYIVDTASVDHIEALNYDLACIEANYSTDEELDKEIQIAEEKGEFTHLKRVKYTHLSQLDALNWLDKNNIKNYIWIHEHKERKNKND